MRQRRICFAWSGLPDYAARCLRSVLDRTADSVEIIGTRPSVPIGGMEESLGRPVHWIDTDDDETSWENMGIGVPQVFFQGGYFVRSFNRLGARCRAAGGKVVLMSDHNWLGTFRQFALESVHHRLLQRSHFEAVLVPGASGIRWARAMGYPRDRVLPGLYGADPALFGGGRPLTERPKTFLFVGQMIPRKNVIGLARAFLPFSEEFPDWELRLCGSGAQRSEIPQHPRILVEEFVQPRRLAELMRKARCLVLPSLEEHWGLVVHEAALSGCALALTRVVGASDDLARASNAMLFPPNDQMAIERALRAIAVWDDVEWRTAESVSRELARGFGPSAFADAVEQLVGVLTRY